VHDSRSEWRYCRYDRAREDGLWVFRCPARREPSQPGQVPEPGSADCEYRQLTAASGFSPQYAGLEELYRTYRERGFEVLGFPCNQFGAQEPGPEAEIGAFCKTHYGVSFPLFAKIEVNSPHAHPFYCFLQESKPGIFGTEKIKWNFTKFLIDRNGNVAGRFGPATKPKTLAVMIEGLLDGQ